MTRSGRSRTPALERAFHHSATALVGLSGIAYFVLADLVPADPEAFSVVGHPWQPRAQHLHVLVAPLAVLSLGLLLREHVIGRLRNPSWRHSRRTGAWLALSFGPMAASGYLLQVAVDEGWRSAWKWTHVVTSVAFLAGYLAHVLLALRKARAEA